MKCYNHHDRDAFAVCKACGKALCLECADEYKNSYLCKDSEACHHVADVNYVYYFRDNSPKSFATCKYIMILLGAFLLGFTVVKSLICLVLPCAFGFSLETILLIVISLLLIYKGVRAKLK